MKNDALLLALQQFQTTDPAAPADKVIAHLRGLNFTQEEIDSFRPFIHGDVPLAPQSPPLEPDAPLEVPFPYENGSTSSGRGGRDYDAAEQAAMPDLDEPFDFPKDIQDELGGRR